MKRATLLLCWVAFSASASGQYLGEEKLDPLQKTAVIDGKERDLDLIGPTIYTNKTTTSLNCASGIMSIGVDFKEPFFGIIFPNGSRTSACQTHGDGKTHYELNLPLKGCGTNRVDRRVFVNNIFVRFHKELELPEDELKTIICRYPSPEVLPPPGPPLPIRGPDPIPPIVNRVGEVEILMIVCAILFMSLLLVGMACSYTCLKKRNIRIVRRRPISGPPSTISKISDYPSESPSSGSEVEELDVQEHEDKLSSVYSDAYVQSEAEIVAAQQVIPPPRPTFMVRVKKPISPPRTPEPDYSLQNALSQSLTTILERDESFRADSLPGSQHALMMTESEDDFYLPPVLHPPPDFEEVHSKKQKLLTYSPPSPPSDNESVMRSESETELIAQTHLPPKHYDIQQIDQLTTSKHDIIDIDETIKQGSRKYLAPIPPSEPDSDYPSESRSVTDMVEHLVVARQPDIISHKVDDIYKTTLIETNVTEDVQKHRRYVKQYHMKPKPIPPPKWNVAIRHYPGPKYADELESSGPEWEAYSEPGSDVFRGQMMQGADDTLSQIEIEMLEHPPPPNWTVLIRVLDPPPTEEAVREILTFEDREKWRQIITTESTLRTMLTTATVREDYEKIRRDQRYEKLFPAKKWDVIIRILSPPERPRTSDETSSEAQSMSDAESLPSSRDPRRPRRFDPPGATGGKRINLPPLYEYDSEGNPVVKLEPPSTRSRRSSKSSMASGIDVRSMAETEVNFSRVQETWSEVSGPSSSGAPRSHADRSNSEITFRPPVIHDDEFTDTDYDERLSARTGRSLARSASEFTEDWRHHDQLDRYSQSSAESRPHRQTERSTSEYMVETHHLRDFPHSPEISPQLEERQPHRYEVRPYGQDNVGYTHEEHFEHREYITEGAGATRVYVQDDAHSGYRASPNSRTDFRLRISDGHETTNVTDYVERSKKTRKK